MTIEKPMPNQGDTNAQGANSLQQIAEHLADSVWKITEAWSDYARTTMAAPLTRAMDEVGLQLRFILGRAPVKQHLQYVENARRTLVSVEYYLQRAHRRGLMDASQAEQLRAKLINLAQRLDQHRASIIQVINKIAEQNRQQNEGVKAVPATGEGDGHTDSPVAH